MKAYSWTNLTNLSPESDTQHTLNIIPKSEPRYPNTYIHVAVYTNILRFSIHATCYTYIILINLPKSYLANGNIYVVILNGNSVW